LKRKQQISYKTAKECHNSGKTAGLETSQEVQSSYTSSTKRLRSDLTQPAGYMQEFEMHLAVMEDQKHAEAVENQGSAQAR
jgi:hypothetical protein